MISDLGDAKVTVCETAREAAAGADVVVTMLSDGDAVLAAIWERRAAVAREHGDKDLAAVYLAA